MYGTFPLLTISAMISLGWEDSLPAKPHKSAHAFTVLLCLYHVKVLDWVHA